MKPLNFRATGTNPCCRGCDIIPNDYKNHLLFSSSSSRLQGHSVDYLPIANNMYSDYFHDLNEGIQGYICYSSINYFLILTNENEEVFRINLLSIIENYDDISLKALLCPDFFKLTPVKRKILLKKKFNLSGHQTHIMLRAFYDYLKQKLLSDANISSISTLYSMLANYKLSLKFHMLTHYQDWILRLGHPFWLNTKHFESSHQRIKKASCLSKNKISRMKTILSKLVLFETTSLNNRSNPKKEISLLRKNWEYIDMCPIFTNKTFSFTYNSLDDSISNSTLNGIGNFGENEIQSMQNVIKMELERIFSGSRKNDINFTEDDELSETEEI
uniref:FERM domain-containing protein n=1 Tax=Strongyloides papillosus TaxID=174720 RepID=A0A0N5CI63_STREA